MQTDFRETIVFRALEWMMKTLQVLLSEKEER